MDVDEEYGEEDFELMLQPFKEAFQAMGVKHIDRWGLK
jgi:hypothetical protein